MSLRVLVTGATGFIGKYLTAALKEQPGIKLAILTRDQTLIKTDLFKGLTIIEYDDSGQLKEQLAAFNAQVVFHLAGFATAESDLESVKKLVKANLEFGSVLLEGLSGTDLELFVNAGTFAEYFKGDGKLDSAYIYAATKTAFKSILDYYVQAEGFTGVHSILYTIYGNKEPERKVIDYILAAIDSEQATDMTDGRQVLDFTHIDDVVNFYLSLLQNREKLSKKQLYTTHVGTRTGISIRDVAQKVTAFCGKTPNINWGGRQYRSRDVMKATAIPDQLAETIGWQPAISIDRGLQRLLNERGLLTS